jgi:hypothetical protein
MSEGSVIRSLRLWQTILGSTPLQIPLQVEHLTSAGLEDVIRDPGTSSDILHAVAVAYRDRGEVIRTLLEHPRLGGETFRFLREEGGAEGGGLKEALTERLGLQVRPGGTPVVHDRVARKAKEDAELREASLLRQVQQMTVAEKVQLALKGGREARMILIRDANKEVALTVLVNPRLSETEVQIIAQSRNVPEDILREIAKRREWIKTYEVITALVNNPRTPIGVALEHVHDLRTRDLLLLEKNRNIPDAVRATAKRIRVRRDRSG